MEQQLFTPLFNEYNQTLLTSSQTVTNALLAAVQPDVTNALMLAIIVIGVMTMFGRMSGSSATLWGLRAVAVMFLLQTANYDQYILTEFTQTIPNWILTSIGAGTSSAATVAGQFDQLKSAVDHRTAVLLTAATGISPSVIAQRLAIYFAGSFADFMLLLCYIVDFIAQCLVDLVAPLGTVLLIAYMFNHTRHWAERWIGKMIALMILQMMVAVLVAILIQQETIYMGTNEAGAGAGVNLDEQISMLWNTGFAFTMGFILLLCLPLIASAIGGSQVSNLVTMPLVMGRAAVAGSVRAAGATAAQTARTQAATTQAAAQQAYAQGAQMARMVPPIGP